MTWYKKKKNLKEKKKKRKYKFLKKIKAMMMGDHKRWERHAVRAIIE